MRAWVGADDGGVVLFGEGELDEKIERRVRGTFGLGCLSSVLDAYLGLMREEAERVTRPPAMEVDGSGEVVVWRF